jgi:hypothetical protein
VEKKTRMAEFDDGLYSFLDDSVSKTLPFRFAFAVECEDRPGWVDRPSLTAL